jgi:hypothetical protein
MDHILISYAAWLLFTTFALFIQNICWLQQKRSKKEGEKIDRSHDVRILQEFYRQFREKHHLEQLEDEDRVRRNSDSYEEDSTTCVILV